MKLIIAGSRDFNDHTLLVNEVNAFVKRNFNDLQIISGDARGADTLGAEYGTSIGVAVIHMPAEWGKYGKSAGYRRNEEMAKIADACICFWDGQSKGTKHMIDLANKHNLTLKVVRT